MASSPSSSPPPNAALSPPRNAAVSPPPSPNLSALLSDSFKIDDSKESKKEPQAVDDSYSFLVGWWFGVSKDSKYPYGHIIQIRADHGRYLARSYSPWQLATAKMGTSLFELYVTSGEESKDKKQAMYLKHRTPSKDGTCVDYVPDLKRLSMPIINLKPAVKSNADIALEGIESFFVALNPRNATSPALQMGLNELRKNADGGSKVQTAIWINFATGNFKEKKIKKTKGQKNRNNKKEKNTWKSEKELRRLPSELERKGCFSFCLTVKEEEDHQSGYNVREGYRAIDHVILDIAECMGNGKPNKKEDQGKFWPVMCSQALNRQPLLSGSTTFNKIEVTVSSDPLNGFYTASNGYLVTEVIQFTRKFGQWQENGETEGPAEDESYDYVEAVKVTGDPDVPAGQVAFRARVGEKYKLHPRSVLEDKFGAVARYKGKGRLTGFQKSQWVDAEVFIIGEEYRKDGFALGNLTDLNSSSSSFCTSADGAVLHI
ncbi:Protein EXECUTER 1, chloroplastic [Heracleum sosnowskyi]|uniref:Protein EXECUTER 1, chloroplastic n=1 Tax=Heracleum sosnowskyi TaxID=360622 RepID=A0AAD8JD09_9APIA|nr:Protein EXECUTER 1, chloroplastic [Heracleum sosnowskyi]